MDKTEEALLLKAKTIISQATEKSNNRYVATVSKLTSVVEQLEDIIKENDKKIFIQRFAEKVMHGNKKYESLLAQCAILTARLETCKNCICSHCTNSACKSSCLICPDMSYVTHCEYFEKNSVKQASAILAEENLYISRPCYSWHLTLKENNTQVPYDVLCMITNKKTGVNYVFLQGKDSRTRKVMKYDKMGGTVTPLNKSDEQEYLLISSKAGQVLNER